jgi:RNA polymerase sigma-70 factor (ECF subfamily)
MEGPNQSIDALLEVAASGDRNATSQLLAGQGEYLAQFVSGRIDRRLVSRIDVGDIVQEILIDAAGKLPAYLRDRPVPFLVWLQSLAIDHLKQNCRTHIRTQKRSICREAPQAGAGDDASSSAIIKGARSREKTPSSLIAGRELYAKVEKLIHELPESDQEILRLRFVEQLSLKEIAAHLGITESALRMRQLRALRRLRELLGEDDE